MQKNPRTVLNEYCQQHNLPTPEYAKRMISPPPQAQWEASVSVNGKWAYSLGVHTKKTAALDSAACNLLLVLSRKESAIVPFKAETIQRRSIAVYRKIYLVDIENKQLFYTRDMDSDSLYIGFLSSIHAAVNKYSNWKDLRTPNLVEETKDGHNQLVYKAEGGVKELADHFLTAFSCYIVDYVNLFKFPTTIFIVSSDNASWCTHLCLLQHARWKGVENLITVQNIA